MSRFVDSLITYRILRLLTTPFEETDAYKLGIIDLKGKELKKMSQLNSVDERNAYTILHRLVFRLKKIIEKVPLENKKILSYAAALALIKEHYDSKSELINLEELYFEKLNTQLDEEIQFIHNTFNHTYTLTFKQFLEDIPANNAGTPGVAGFTPDTVGVPVSVQKKRKKMFKRDGVNYVDLDQRILRNLQKTK